MSYFVIKVKTGTELLVKEMLQQVLSKKTIENVTVKGIYAMETFTQLVHNESETLEIQNLQNSDITSFLHLKRLQAGLNNLRVAYDNLKPHADVHSMHLLESYREQIRELSKKIQETRKNVKKVISVLKGYILIEVEEMVTLIDNTLWHVIKDTPNVTGLCSNYNVPEEEIEYFFSQLDITPELEMDLGDIDEIENEVVKLNTTSKYLINQANLTIGTEREKELLAQYDLVVSQLRKFVSLRSIIMDEFNISLSKKASYKYPMLQSMFARCNINNSRKRLILNISYELFSLIPTIRVTLKPNIPIYTKIEQLVNEFKSLLNRGELAI